MTLLLNCQNLSKSYGSRKLFKDLSFSIFTKQQVGLIGPNGAGKSSLLQILAGKEKPDSGLVSYKKGLVVGYVPQVSLFPAKSPKQILLDVLKDQQMADYEKETLAETWLSKLGFKGDEPVASNLSGGWKKRLSLAHELIRSPDLLLLDEPTNHLDLEGILWLEKFLKRESTSYILVSHDRSFLEQMVNRVVEINPTYPEGLFSIDGSYLNFLEKKEEFLKGQLQQERSVASKARRELDWLRTSPKARTTKAQSRVDGAHEVLETLSDLQQRNRGKKASIDFAATERETQKLLSANNLTKSLGNRLLFKGLDLLLSPGRRIGLMGPNGSGKSTLLKMLAGEIAPDVGTIKRADDLKIVYFDQHRAKLPGHITLRQALAPAGEYVDFRGQKIHVNGWCKRFLFSPDILDLQLDALSGGEKARISIAHLMLQPADILLLDEPTNDLDITTLETLEESLLEFPGAVVLITHDRRMLERTCNGFLALGDPEKTTIFAEYAQWERSLQKETKEATTPKEKSASSSTKAKLSYMEKREYEQMEENIGKKEAEIAKLNQLLQDPVISQDALKLQTLCTEINLAETQLEQLFSRWEELEKKQR